MNLVKFEGAGPYALPVLQSTSASAQDETVEMALSVLVDGNPQTVRVQMASKIADALATQLVQASSQARANARKS